jgi:murein L,D-transpeptidase YafK
MRSRLSESLFSGRAGAKSLRASALVIAAGLGLSACQDTTTLTSGRSLAPIPAQTVALMEQKGSTKNAPMLIRAYKKEAELEIWKMRADGTYAHLKTYPMCRWSGQLGPKKREGDRQVPEGFYSITPGQMNPNSQFYLAFNVGYPNALDKAQGYTGGAIMVHGACASAGCFSMTDEQIAEIYAIARESFGGGQRAIQMQTMPFRMNAENLAKHRLDPNIKFWREIKEGYDHFEVSKREPQVAFCGRRYVFNASAADGSRLDAAAACPPLQEDSDLKNLVAQKRATDDAKVAELAASGVKPIKIQYADGGQHPSFTHVMMVSRPDALEKGPVEIALDDKGRPLPATAVRVAAARAATPAPASAAATASASATSISRAQQPTAATAYAPSAEPSAASAPFYKRWLGLGSDSAAAASQPVAAQPAPLPPRRDGAAPAARDSKVVDPRQKTSELPALIRGAQPVLPTSLMAYSPIIR